MTNDFDKQPTLHSDTVTLRPLREDDWQDLFAVASDPLIWELHPAHNRWQEEVFRRFFDEAMACGMAFAAIDTASNQLIGSTRYDFGRALEGEAEIGWTFLARKYWGGLHNRAMKRLMIEHALKFVDQTIFLVGDTNWRSRRAMEKIGGLLTDRLDIAEMAGEQITHVIYAIDRKGFASGPLMQNAR